jgi:hypothetical protein
MGRRGWVILSHSAGPDSSIASIIRGSAAPLVALAFTMATLSILLCVVFVSFAAATTCPANSDPYTASASVLEACHTRVIPLTSVTSLPYGGSQYNYTQPNGEVMSLTLPPPSFNAATASASERETFGIPPEPPANSPEYGKWKAMIANGVHFVTPPPALDEVPNSTASGEGALTNGSSELASSIPAGTVAGKQHIWSGDMDWHGEGKFTHSTIYYVEPYVKENCPDEEPVAAFIWDGIGGWYNENLGQDGTALGVTGIGHDQAWWEVLPEEPPKPEEEGVKPVLPLYATPGKEFLADTEYKGSRKYSFYFYSWEHGESAHATGEALPGKEVDANVNDFIVERPLGKSLIDFGSVEMQGYTNGKAFGENKVQQIPLYNGEGTLLAAPTALWQKYAFNDKYYHCERGSEKAEGENGSQTGELPSVTTESASAITETEAQLAGKVNPEGFETDYHFEYGTEAENFGSSTKEVSAGAGSSAVPAEGKISGLQPDTTYYYRLIADSPTGISAGAEKAFKTTGSAPPPPPTATTEGATGLGPHKATLEATVNPNGSATDYYFEYGKAAGLFEADVPVPPGESAGSGTSPVKVSAHATELEANTTYYYRVVATSSSGTSYGTEKELKTPSSWTIQTTINPHGSPESDDELASVSCWSATGCEAAGENIDSKDQYVSLLEHWNGSAWEEQTPPKAPSGATGSFLESVSCSASTACAATGYYENKEHSHYTLAERWEGSAWQLESTPTEGSDTTLDSVSCTSATSCIAVGYDVSGSPAKTEPITESWNGTKWTIKESATLPTEDKQAWFHGVSCTSKKACIAVGSYVSSSLGVEALAESWNGTKWSLQSAAQPTNADAIYLFSVSCSAASACAAVGHYNNLNTGRKEALIEQWNGTSWQIEPSANPPLKPFEEEFDWELLAVSCPASKSCIAVGSYSDSPEEPQGLLGEVWNGTSWQLELPAERSSVESSLTGLSCVSATTCTAVGRSDKASNHTYHETLAERGEEL